MRLIPFTFSAEQTAVIEFGHLYVRFHIGGATLLDPGTGLPYQVTTPYIGADLFDLHYTQSADVITIAHPSYATRELKRLGATNWTLTSLSFAAPTNAPTTLAVTATVAEDKNKTTQKYVVTTVASDGVTESLPSDPIGVSNNLTLAGNYNTLSWSAVGSASRYNAYKLRGGIYGYIGQARPNTGAATKTISTIDRPGVGNKTVTVTTTAAHVFANEDLVLIEDTGVSSLNGAWVITVTGASTFTYESVTTYHEQRRWFAGTNDKPQVLFGTRTGTESNLTSSIPSREADGMELRIASSQYNKIRHLVALSDLIAFTAGGEFRIYSDGAPAITPTSVTIKPQGYAGASNVQPVVTTGSILYVQAQGSRLRELSYSWEANSYRTVDASIMAPHRFNGFTVAELAYSRAPDSIAWAVRDDGTLLGLTYVPDQQVYGWHAHDTDGEFESVCVVPENNEDVLYAVVRRTIGASQLRYIERLHTRMLVDLEDAFFVDSGLTYSGAPATTISGLTHLEGKTVDILADGAVEARQVVTGGQVVLGTAASLVHIGLPITADLRTLPLAMEGAQAAGQGTVKNVNKVHLRVSQSSVIKAGPTFDRLREYPARAVTDPYGSPPALRDGELALTIDPSWNQDAALCVRQDLPLPLTVLSMTLEIQSGG